MARGVCGHEGLHSRKVQRPGKVIALARGTSQGLQPVCLFGRLDAFGSGLHMQALCQRDHRLHDGFRFGAAQNGGDERAVDFEPVKRKAAQVRQ